MAYAALSSGMMTSWASSPMTSDGTSLRGAAAMRNGSPFSWRPAVVAPSWPVSASMQ